MLQSINSQSGRFRYYFVERLHKSKTSFYKSIMDKLSVTIAGLDSALDQGLQLRSKGEEQVGLRQIMLESQLQHIDRVYQELLGMRNVMLSSGGEGQVPMAAGNTA